MGINVLSCFDGISCGKLALQRAEIEVDNYFASEIDKYAIKIAQKNFPDTIQLGDIRNWQSWKLPRIDLLIAGSPCQGFSNAGLGLNFEDPRSKLFFVFCDILKDLKEKNPNLKFMLENVKMKKEWRDIISEYMGVEPVLINSALVSAQNRQRLYWANWTFPQPEDRHIYLADIIEDGEVDREKSYCIDANYHKGGNPRSYFEGGKRQLVFEHQSQKRAMVRVIQGAAIRNQVTNHGTEEQYQKRWKVKLRSSFLSAKIEWSGFGRRGSDWKQFRDGQESVFG
jgi:site-specific DNA-cytosine methylase